MMRMVYVIVISLPWVIFYLIKMNYMIRHMDHYTEDERYRTVRRVVEIMKRNGRIRTEAFGVDNLPKDGGYVMYPNHQGKYDALGIISVHQSPCTFMIDEQRSKLLLAREVTDVLKATRLDKSDLKAQVKSIFNVSDQVEQGRRYIVFPEGGYKDNHNNVQEFMSGAFKCSIRSKTPIVPVALIDSYKVFGINSLKKIKTEVHFLKPLYYEEYQKMNSRQIAQLVKERIEAVIKSNGETA